MQTALLCPHSHVTTPPTARHTFIGPVLASCSNRIIQRGSSASSHPHVSSVQNTNAHTCKSTRPRPLDTPRVWSAFSQGVGNAKAFFLPPSMVSCISTQPLITTPPLPFPQTATASSHQLPAHKRHQHHHKHGTSAPPPPVICPSPGRRHGLPQAPVR